jgi:hypothetical protein
MIDDDKKKKLEEAGFQVGSLAEFLDLSLEEQELIENVIVRNGKPLGTCECLGKGKNSCKGNGWVKVQNGYQRCPSLNFFKTI